MNTDIETSAAINLESLLTPVTKLSNDVRKALRQRGGGITSSEARYLVDLYYDMQKARIVSNNRVKGLDRDARKSGNVAEPHQGIDWLFNQQNALENQIKAILSIYVETHPMVWFFEQTLGVGPVIAAGLLAHIDIDRAPTAGHAWRFAGLDPSQKWASRQELTELYDAQEGSVEERTRAVSKLIGRDPETVIRDATTNFATGKTSGKLTKDKAVKSLCRIPFNRQLKTICWKLGESFVKVCNKPGAYYGRVYKERKGYEWGRNLRGELSDQATSKLAKTKIGSDTDAKAWYAGECSPEKAREMLEAGETPTAAKCRVETGGVPMLPPAHIQARAKRYAVKLFLAHLHQRWREEEGLPCPAPWVISHGGHAHYHQPPQVAPM